MTDIYEIKISCLFNDRNRSEKFVREHMRNFMTWLISEGHIVSFSENINTMVNGNDISNDEMSNEIYNRLADKFIDIKL